MYVYDKVTVILTNYARFDYGEFLNFFINFIVAVDAKDYP